MFRFTPVFSLFLVTLIGAPVVSQAQNKIIVINKDGTREEVILNQPTPPKVEKAKAPAAEPSSPPKQTAQDLLKTSTPVEEAPKPAIKAPSPPKKAKAKIKSASKPKSKKAKAEPRKVVVPYPKPKPNEEEIAKAKAAKPLFNYIDPANIPAGTPITKDLATRAALEVAPPSRGFTVSVTDYKGAPAYQVRFKTEGGFHDVIVDGATGKILKK